MATAATAQTPVVSSRLLPKIVHPASRLNKEDHGKITVEARKLASATGVRGRPRSCPEMSIEHLLGRGSSRLPSSRLRLRTCSARQQRGQGQASGHRIPQFTTTEEVWPTSTIVCVCRSRTCTYSVIIISVLEIKQY